MAVDISGAYNAILNLTQDLVGRQVVRVNDTREPPTQGEIIAVGVASPARAWVVWEGGSGEPTPHHARELLALKANELKKTLQWHGKKLSGLEEFLRQVRREGANGDTELNPGVEAHVHIKVELPLATEPADPEPKHDHTFDTDCTVSCPRNPQYFGPRPGMD